MKIKLVVIDLEVPRRIKRAGLAILAAGAVVLATSSGVFAAVPAIPHMWNDGDTLTAADLNGAFTALDTHVTDVDSRVTTLEGAPKPPIITEWQAYTPKVQYGTTDAGTTQTTTAVWRRVGDSVEVRLVTTMSACTVAGPIRYFLPNNVNISLTKSSQYDEVGSGLAYGSGTSNVVRIVSVTNIATQIQGAVAIDASGDGGGGMTCAEAGVGGQIRVHFTVPIDGWTTTTP